MAIEICTEQTPVKRHLLCAVMELCWITACSHYIVSATTALACPIPMWGAFYIMGYLFSAGFKPIGHRRGTRFLIQGIIWCCITAAVLYRLGLLQWPRDISSWYQTLLVAGITPVFWHRGGALSGRRITYGAACNQFDLGLAMFSALYLIDLIIGVKIGIKMENHFAYIMLLCFFLAGPAAIFTAAQPVSRSDGYAPGIGGQGILVTGVILVLFFSLASISLFKPALTYTAELGSDLLKQIVDPLSPYLISLLIFIFSPRGKSPESPVKAKEADNSVLAAAGLESDNILMSILMYGFITFFVVMIFAILLCLLYLIFRYLSTQSISDHRPDKRVSLSVMLKAVLKRIVYFIKKVRFRKDRNRPAIDGYLFMTEWGRRSGFPKVSTETPDEYACRLETHFSDLKNEIRIISHAFQKEVFGRIRTEPEKVDAVINAKKKMKHPAYWPARLRLRLTLLKRMG